jgi:NADPH2:quinone reductase
VIDYRSESVVDAVHQISGRGVDLIVEVAPNANAGLDLDVLAPNGTIAVYASESDAPLPIRCARAWSKTSAVSSS